MSHITTATRPASAAVAAPSQEAAPAQLPRPVQPPLAGGGKILPIIPQSLAEVRQMAEIIARSGAAPKSYRMDGGAGPVDVDMVCAAILVGLEVGLAPMAAVSGIVMFDDGPAIWGDARDGLVAASGLLEDMKEEMVLDEEGVFLEANCTVWRKGRKTPIVQTVTRGQAALAGWLENENWKTNPNRMAQMRAKGWANRDAFPDVLKGLRSHDEAEDFLDVTSKGAASTTPPAPKRSDFMPAAGQQREQPAAEVGATGGERYEPVGQDHAEPEGWPLYDETGETVGTYEALRWVDEFERLVNKLDGPRWSTAVDNNRDTAAKVVAECSDKASLIEAAGLTASYEFAKAISEKGDDRGAAASEPENLVPSGTQDECADKLVSMIEASTTVARVNRILKVNIKPMMGWTKANRDKVLDAQDARLEALQAGAR